MDYYEDYGEYSDDINENEYTDIYSPQIDESYSNYEQCVYPTLIDGINNFLGPILISNIILKILTHFVVNHFIKQLITITIGVSLLFYHFSDEYKLFIVCLTYIAISSSITQLFSKQIIWFICIISVCINELTILYDPSFIRLRSHLMLIVMKIISFKDEIVKDHQIIDFKNFYSAICYLLHPLSLLLGVWHPFRPNNTNSSIIRPILESFYYLLMSIMFLLLSTCLVHYYIGERLLSTIIAYLAVLVPMPFVYLFEICLTVYLTALQFRFSHYFICFATQSMLKFWNYDLDVTHPLSIEFPRSLVDVVIAWNIPMHIWLKNHVFNPSKKTFGAFQAIFITYFMSSFLHGFNFQIWSVLLTLGLLTKVEYDLREELSSIFKSCIHVRRCLYTNLEINGENNAIKSWNIFKNKSNQKVCVSKWKHQNTPYNSNWVQLINLLFSILAITHLAYLGSTFDGKEESSKVVNVIAIWRELKFFSHVTSILTFIFYKLL